MNYKMMGRFIGKILVVEGVFMVPALLISLWKREYASAHAFWWSLVIILGASGLLMLLCRGSKINLLRRTAWPVWESAGLS